uniref:Uncharacterized protein n=1 Tax=uncultured marine group II/III euryarchaeote KM3_60_A11 TaxID=1456469 RepID=A0A075HFH5_9EURY|nr:hypothetical protein [uncultured marine group II/III euryarchaeote KM3_60_A11]
MMETEDDKLKKFSRKSEIESEIDSKKISLRTLTNLEDFQQGKFPKNLVEEFKPPDSLPNSILFSEIESKHKEILEERPLPELLENSQLIENLEDELKPPVMGKIYEEKEKYKISPEDKRTAE